MAYIAPTSCIGGTFGLSLMLGLVLEPQVCRKQMRESIQFNKCNHLFPKGQNYSDFKPNHLPGQSNHATLTFIMWMSGPSDILERVLLKRGNLSQKSLLKRVHISTFRFTHKDGRSRHGQQIVWDFSCIWALLLGLTGTERGSRCQLQYKSLWCQSAARCPVWREPFLCSSAYFFRTPPASQFLNGPLSAEFLHCKWPSGIKNMKDLFLPNLVWPFGNFVSSCSKVPFQPHPPPFLPTLLRMNWSPHWSQLALTS